MESVSMRVSVIFAPDNGSSLRLDAPRPGRSFNYTAAARRHTGITRKPSWGYPLSVAFRPGLGNVEHAVCETPLVVKPHKQVRKAIAIGTGLAAINDGRMRIVI